MSAAQFVPQKLTWNLVGRYKGARGSVAMKVQEARIYEWRLTVESFGFWRIFTSRSGYMNEAWTEVAWTDANAPNATELEGQIAAEKALRDRYGVAFVSTLKKETQ